MQPWRQILAAGEEARASELQGGTCQPVKDESDQPSTGAPRSIETTNRTQARVASRWKETKKETVLCAFGGKRPRKETQLVALA